MISFTAAQRALVMVGLVVAAAQAAADPAVTFTNTTGNTLSNPPFTLGWSFTANANITVTALGLFDDSQDGLADRHELGLWNSAGTLLGSTSLGAGTSGTLTNQFRYASLLAGIDLLAGESYRVGALYLTGNDALVNPGVATGFATAGQIAFGQATFGVGGSLSDPNQVFGGQGFFGANFLFDATATVPEPGSLLLVVLALGSLGAAARARKASSR